MKRTEFSEQQIALIVRQAEEGTTIGEVCRKAGITHFNEGIGPYFKQRRRQRGPQTRKTLPTIISYLAMICERETRKAIANNLYCVPGHFAFALDLRREASVPCRNAQRTSHGR